MNPQDLLRIVDSLHREKQIDPELVMQAIEAALITAAKRQFGDEADVDISITRGVGNINATVDGKTLSQDEIGRIGAQTAKQVIIQKLKEAEEEARKKQEKLEKERRAAEELDKLEAPAQAPAEPVAQAPAEPVAEPVAQAPAEPISQAPDEPVADPVVPPPV